MNPTGMVEPPTDDELAELWNSVPHVFKASSPKNNAVHLPDATGACRCSRDKVTTLVEKDPSTIPIGFWPVCRTCLHRWRMGMETALGSASRAGANNE